MPDPVIDLTKVVLTEEFSGEDEEETARVRDLETAARHFVDGFSWSGKVIESYVGLAVGEVIGVFLFRIDPAQEQVGEWLWVVVGDLPPAYLVPDDAPDPAGALNAYIREMRSWVDAVKAGEPTGELIPVLTADGGSALPPTEEHAELLESRLSFLEENKDDLVG